ncbi:hypothetical protein [Sinorhizobium arboris]|uniref:hypothetical protein n=1 Tax=Sinorhizobium arboris TaxID=76745 RepID=UPI001F3C6A0B|nr:hypothetical protein [Sinorhizobium arboris]
MLHSKVRGAPERCRFRLSGERAEPCDLVTGLWRGLYREASQELRQVGDLRFARLARVLRQRHVHVLAIGFRRVSDEPLDA